MSVVCPERTECRLGKTSAKDGARKASTLEYWGRGRGEGRRSGFRSLLPTFTYITCKENKTVQLCVCFVPAVLQTGVHGGNRNEGDFVCVCLCAYEGET